MARLARIVVPGVPHHVTQRGNRRETTFFEDGDYRFYLSLPAEASAKAGTALWGYCPMPSHLRLGF
jgi:putative transposase